MNAPAITWTQRCGCVVQADPWAHPSAQGEQRRLNRPSGVVSPCERHASTLANGQESETCACRNTDCAHCIRVPGPLGDPSPEAPRIVYAADTPDHWDYRQ